MLVIQINDYLIDTHIHAHTHTHRFTPLLQAALSGYSGGDSTGEVWLQVSAYLPPPPLEEDPGTVAGCGNGYDSRQRKQGAPLFSAGREFCHSSGVFL